MPWWFMLCFGGIAGACAYLNSADYALGFFHCLFGVLVSVIAYSGLIALVYAFALKPVKVLVEKLKNGGKKSNES